MQESEFHMSTVQSAQQVLDRHFLEVRCGLLDLAAAFDRMERSDGFSSAVQDSRYERLRQGLQILMSSGTDRAERLQMLFSDEYIPDWK